MPGIRRHSHRPGWNLSEGKDKNSGRLGQTIYKSWLKKLLILILGQPPSIATLATTAITTGCTAPGGCFAYTLKPTDAKGNLVGPGKASLFALTKFTGQLLGPVKDNLDGTYTIEVSYPTRDTKPPVLQIGGTAIPLPSASGGLLKWWWLLLLILLVGIVLLISRRNRS